MNSKILKTVQSIVLIGLSASTMGNSGCDKPSGPPPRVLARKVQMGAVTAPPIQLPPEYGGTFNFSLVASTQMQSILGSSTYFSTANIDPNGSFNGGGLPNAISSDFNSCEPVVPPNQTHAEIQSRGMINEFQAQGISGNITQSYYASCLIDVPQAQVTSSILDFELVGGGGLNVGAANLSILGGLDFNFSKYSLQVAMNAKSPLDVGNSTIASSLQNTYATNGSASLTLNIGIFSIGPSGYFKTPLSKIVQDGLTNGVHDLYNSWTANDPWYAMILKACDTYIYINGSRDLGLKVGDVVEIKNVLNMWHGNVCDSQWVGDIPDVTPVGYAQIVSLGDNISAAQVIKGNPNYPHANTTIFPGARIYMHQMADVVANTPGLPLSPPAPAPKAKKAKGH